MASAIENIKIATEHAVLVRLAARLDHLIELDGWLMQSMKAPCSFLNKICNQLAGILDKRTTSNVLNARRGCRRYLIHGIMN